MRTLKQLQDFADKCNCTVERVQKGRYEWHRNSNHSVVSICSTVEECYWEIYWEVYRPIVDSHKNRA